MIPSRVEVAVIGAGPAGATVAAILAKQGVSVVLLEREEFPRYHIGESLLPSIIPILGVSGALPDVEDHGFVKKPGAYLEWGREKWSLIFGELSGNPSYSYQVTRADFDHILLKNARRAGAQVFEGNPRRQRRILRRSAYRALLHMRSRRMLSKQAWI